MLLRHHPNMIFGILMGLVTVGVSACRMAAPDSVDTHPEIYTSDHIQFFPAETQPNVPETELEEARSPRMPEPMIVNE